MLPASEGRFRRARELFESVADLEPSRQERTLEEACGGDLELRRTVEGWLRSDRRSPAWLEGHAAELAAPALEDLAASTEWEGVVLGAWVVGEEIGRGGMSRVFRAERSDGLYRQTVALKILDRLSGDRAEAERRFTTEREILASLSHPSIAHVLDGGVTDDGRPFLVMELVEGRTLDVYCRETGADLDARLELFRQVCQAVEHAHHRLVVHRDLKPGNILVTDDGRVKLVDFGIAKLLDPLRERETRTGLYLLTPQYAAPEQVRGQPITTATDVYALGVVLYELLTGTRPYELEGKTPSEIERLICDQEPTRPSTAVTAVTPLTGTASDERPSGARSREGVARSLRGDLDVVILKALRKSPPDRYATAAQLEEDLDRTRRGLPIRARKATSGYRLRRFVARHRLGAASALAAFVVGVLFLTALVGERREALVQRDRARSEADKSREVADFLLGLFEANDPFESQGEETTARVLLERGAAQAEEMADRPLVQAEMYDVMGRVYRRLGATDRARALLERALEIRRRELGPMHLDVGTTESHLGQLDTDDGKQDGSVRHYREALRIYEAALPPDDLRRIELTLDLGIAVMQTGALDEAAPLVEASVESLRAHPEASPEQVAHGVSELGVLRYRQGDARASEALAREGLALRQEALGDRHPSVFVSMVNLAFLLRQQGKLEESEAQFRDVLARREEVFGPEHPRTINVRSHLAITLGMQGRYEEAGELFREVLDQRRRVLGPDHPDVANAIGNLATLAEREGDLEEAEALRREALDLKTRLLGEGHPQVVSLVALLAGLAERQGRYQQAETLGRRALTLQRSLYGDEHPEVATSLIGIASALRGQGDLDAAEASLREGMEMRRRLLAPDHREVGTGLVALGSLLTEKSEPVEAESVLREALGILTAGQERSPDVAWCRHELGKALIAAGRASQAEEQLSEALSIRRELLPRDHPDLEATARLLGELGAVAGGR